MRAYLTVIVGSGVCQDRANNLKFEAKPVLLNAGYTPAHKIRYTAKAAILSFPLPDDFAFPLPELELGERILGPQQKFEMSAVVDDYCNDIYVDSIKIANGRALYIWGVVSYEDIFGESQTTRFCQFLTFPGNQVVGYYTPAHNDAT
jgi:hypothetical protein